MIRHFQAGPLQECVWQTMKNSRSIRTEHTTDLRYSNTIRGGVDKT